MYFIKYIINRLLNRSHESLFRIFCHILYIYFLHLVLYLLLLFGEPRVNFPNNIVSKITFSFPRSLVSTCYHMTSVCIAVFDDLYLYNIYDFACYFLKIESEVLLKIEYLDILFSMYDSWKSIPQHKETPLTSFVVSPVLFLIELKANIQQQKQKLF